MLGEYISKVEGPMDKDVRWVLNEIDRGLRKRHDPKKKWEDIESFEDMNQWSGRRGEYDEPTINKLGTFLRTRRSVLGYHNPRAKFEPRTADGYEEMPIPQVGPDGTPMIGEDGQVVVRMVQKYKVSEALLNNIVEQPLFGIHGTMNRLIRSGDMSYGVVKACYVPTFSTPPKKKRGKQEIPINEDGTLDFSDYEMSKVDGSPITDDSDNLISRKDTPTWEDWCLDWVSAHRIIMDPDCGNDDTQARWIVEEEERPVADVKADPLFKHTRDLKATGELDWMWEGVGRSGGFTMSDQNGIEKEKIETVRLFHFWDCVQDRYMVLADGHGKFLRDEAAPRGVCEHPYAMYRPHERIGDGTDFYQRPICADLLPIAIQYNMAMRDLVRAMQAKRKVFVRDGAIDGTNIDTFQSDEDMALVKLNEKVTATGSISDSLVPYTPPPIPESIYANLARLDNDFWETAGMPPEAAGAPKSDTATQVREMGKYSGTRIETDRRTLGESLRVAFKKLWDSIEANMTRERAIQIVGPDGEVFTGLVDPEMIKGDFDVTIDVEDMSPKDSAVEGAQMLQLIAALGNSPFMVADKPLAKEICGKFGIKNERFIDALVGQAQMQVQMAMMQAMPPEPSPEAGAPENEADAISQTGAGSQVPRMQGAT